MQYIKIFPVVVILFCLFYLGGQLDTSQIELFVELLLDPAA